ncbi:GntR family transcriptional regulator, partial [Calditrichota bacterium]
TILSDLINNDVYKTYDRLPSENELAEQYQISRQTAQKALKSLVDQGIAHRIQGKGTFVSDKTITYSITAALSYSSEIIGLNKIPKSKLIHAKEITTSGLIARNLSIESGSPVYSIQRVRYVDDIPMSLQTSYLPKYLVPDLIDKKFEDDSLFKTIKNEYGLEIGKANEFMKSRNCESNEAKLLEIEEGSAVFLLERITKLKNGTVLEFVRTILRGDKSKISVELSNNSYNGSKIYGM